MAVKSKNKEQRAAQRAKEDRTFTLILGAFALCIILEILLIPIYRAFYSTDAYALEYSLQRLWWLGLIASAVCCAGGIFARRGGKRPTLLFYLTALFLCGALTALACGSLGYTGAKLACIILPVLTVLYCVLLIYQREFFVSALSLACSVLALWVRRGAQGQSGVFICIAAAALAALLLVWSVAASRMGGRLWRKGPRFYRPGASWPTLFAALAVALLAPVGALLFGAMFAYVGMFVLAGLIFVGAVYYTVKLL